MDCLGFLIAQNIVLLLVEGQRNDVIWIFQRHIFNEGLFLFVYLQIVDIQQYLLRPEGQFGKDRTSSESSSSPTQNETPANSELSLAIAQRADKTLKEAIEHVSLLVYFLFSLNIK